MSDMKFMWDGEKIKQTFEPRKYTPKQIIEMIDYVKAQVKSNEEQLVNTEKQLERIKENLKNLKEDEKAIVEFEEKSVQIQKDKLEYYIRLYSAEALLESKKKSEKTIAKDPNAYTEEQKKNLYYVDYQRALATHKKVSENIARRIISKYLYDEPIFENPFK